MLQLQRLLQCSSVTTASASAAVLAESSSSYPCSWNNSCRDLLQTCYRACCPSGSLLLQHLLQCFPSLPESSSSYLCSWKSSCLDLSLTSSAATAIADTLYCFSSSICYSVCRSLVLLLLLLLQHTFIAATAPASVDYPRYSVLLLLQHLLQCPPMSFLLHCLLSQPRSRLQLSLQFIQ